MNDTEAASLLLTMFGATKANFWLRVVVPEDIEDYARSHDANVWACFREILDTPHAPATAHVRSPLRQVSSGVCVCSTGRVLVSK